MLARHNDAKEGERRRSLPESVDIIERTYSRESNNLVPVYYFLFSWKIKSYVHIFVFVCYFVLSTCCLFRDITVYASLFDKNLLAISKV